MGVINPSFHSPPSAEPVRHHGLHLGPPERGAQRRCPQRSRRRAQRGTGAAVLALPQLEHWPSSSCSLHPPTPPPGSTWGGLVEKASDAPPLLAAWGSGDDIGGSALVRSMTRQVLAQCRRSPGPRRHKRAPRHAPPAPRPVHRHAGGGPQKPPPQPLWYASARACCWPVESHGRHRGVGGESRHGRDGANGACQPLCRRHRPTTSLAPTDRRGRGLASKACSCVVGGSGNGTVEGKCVGGALVGSGADRRASAAPRCARRKWKSNARVRRRQC